MNTRPVEIVGLGTVVVDQVVRLAGPLTIDAKHPVAGTHTQVGGPVPTALVLLQRWGMTTSFIGGWGDDAHGALIDEDLIREQVDTAHAHRVPGGETGYAQVWLDGVHATRTIAFRRSTLSWDAWSPEAILVQDVRAIHLDGWPAEPARALAAHAKAHGCLISMDTGSVKPGMASLLPLVDVLNVSVRFLPQWFDEPLTPPDAIRVLRGLGPTCVTVTDGKNGAWIGGPDGVYHQPAYPVTSDDTTGAGDIFSGALLYAVLQGWPEEQRVRFASAAAALKCRTLGNRDALPTLAAVRNLAAKPDYAAPRRCEPGRVGHDGRC